MIVSSRVRAAVRSNRLLVLMLGIFLLYALVAWCRLRSSRWRLEISLADIEEAEMGTPSVDHVTGEKSSPRVLIVSALFPVEQDPMRSHRQHDNWLNSFLNSISTDLYLYTTPQLAEMLPRLWEDYSLPPGMTIDGSYSSPFDIQPLQAVKKSHNKTVTRIEDKRNNHYLPDFQVVVGAKPFLLDKAIEQLKKQSKTYDYVFWNDASSFRTEKKYTRWPSPKRVDQVWDEARKVTGRRKEDLLFLPMSQAPRRKFRTWKEELGPIVNPVPFIEGSFFGGSPSAIEWFAKTFYTYRDYFLSQGFVVGEDEDIYNALVLLFPERVFTVWPKDPLAPAHQGIGTASSFSLDLRQDFLGECGDERSYYQFWLADRATRDTMRLEWLKEKKWRWWGWWRDRKVCRLTRATSMLDALQRTFGDPWKPPSRSTAVQMSR